jgi:hypothetical protein
MARSTLPLPKFVAKFEAVEALQKWEDANNKYVEESVRDTVNAHAEKVAERARTLVPEKTGLLKSTIHVAQGRSPLKAFVKTDHGKAPHDFLVHFGTVHSGGRPFLYQANEQLAHELPAAIRTELTSNAE